MVKLTNYMYHYSKDYVHNFFFNENVAATIHYRVCQDKFLQSADIASLSCMQNLLLLIYA